MKELGVKPTVVIPDTAPLIHLAAADALSILNAMGRVVIPDVVASEVTYFEDKPYASEVAGWIARGQQPRSNQPVEIAQTDIGIAAWLADNLAHIGGPALVIHENGRVPGMLSREGVAAVVALATTRNLLTMAQENGIIENAEAVWQRIMAAVPTANPASVLTIINPGDP